MESIPFILMDSSRATVGCSTLLIEDDRSKQNFAVSESMLAASTIWNSGIMWHQGYRRGGLGLFLLPPSLLSDYCYHKEWCSDSGARCWVTEIAHCNASSPFHLNQIYEVLRYNVFISKVDIYIHNTCTLVGSLMNVLETQRRKTGETCGGG